MELKDRILKIMALERLSASVFADSIGVQRSSISHILSGRNKPSLEFIQKVLASYPKYSTEWLILDTGEPIKQNNINQNTTKNHSELETNLFASNNKAQIEPFIAPTQPKSNITPEPASQPKLEPKIEQELPKNIVSTEKKVDHIVIFYTDKTFTSYAPNS